MAAHALNAANAAIAQAPEVKKDPIIPLTIKAHALMYLGRETEALAIHEANRGKKVASSTWESEIASDFQALTKAGQAHPLMEKVRQLLKIE